MATRYRRPVARRLGFVGSALSLRIFRAAGALTGGIVSSSRLSAGEGTGGTEKFSSLLRTVFFDPAPKWSAMRTLRGITGSEVRAPLAYTNHWLAATRSGALGLESAIWSHCLFRF